MKQKIASGASWMTSPISRIETSNTPSIALLRVAVRGPWTSSRPIPKNSAKNITARMSFSLIAVMKFDGTIPITASIPVLASPDRAMIPFAASPPWASSSRAAAGSTPSPGRIRLTTVRLIATAIAETTTV